MPLVYDIQELFRWIVDLSVLQMREGKKLKKSDLIVTEKTTEFICFLKVNNAKQLSLDRIVGAQVSDSMPFLSNDIFF
jgi:hypothetical protein